MDCVPYSCHGHVWLSFFHSASTGRAPLTGPMLNRIVLCELWGLNLHTATFVGRPSSYLINNLDFLKHILFSLCHSEKKCWLTCVRSKLSVNSTSIPHPWFPKNHEDEIEAVSPRSLSFFWIVAFICSARGCPFLPKWWKYNQFMEGKNSYAWKRTNYLINIRSLILDDFGMLWTVLMRDWSTFPLCYIVFILRMLIYNSIYKKPGLQMFVLLVHEVDLTFTVDHGYNR